MNNKQYVYFGEIERFGYTMHCIGNSEQEVKEALIKAYIESYKKVNGADPRKDGTDYYDLFLDELYIEKREIGKVYWD